MFFLLSQLVLVLGLLATLNFSSAAQVGKCWRSTPCSGPTKRAFEGPWSTNIYAPKSRSLVPLRITDTKGRVIGPWNPGWSTLKGNGSTIVLDFGIEVGGIVHLEFTANTATQIGLAFSEARDWIGQWSDSSNGRFRGADGAVYVDVKPSGWAQKWAMPDKVLRGGFRYLTLFLKDAANDTSVLLWNVNVEIGFQPTWSDLTAYQGYFHSSDVELNKIWYAGAYTIQTNCVPPNTGRQVPMLTTGWANNATMGPGDTIIVDGAKRDRAVWPGDMGIAVPSAFFSTGDLDSIKNALQIMFDTQMTSGELYEAGPPLLQKNSDTYHMWTLIGTYNYILYTDDMAFLDKNWQKYQKAMDYVLKKVNSRNNLLKVTGTRDWARWHQGDENSQANMLLYHTLVTGQKLATWKAEAGAAVRGTYASKSVSLRNSINTQLFDEKTGAFKDSLAKSDLWPQDANSLAVLFGVAAPDRAKRISKSLLKNWTPIGAEAPELPGNISPFISSFEIQAHFLTGETARALDLIRRTWGWYLQHEGGTQSTIIEGYRTDGTFGYRAERGYSNDPSYVSHAHGWSTGPTSALTNFIAGIDIQERAGAQWSVKPQFGVLEFAEAGFMTKKGKFRTRWERSKNERAYNITIETPIGTQGRVVLPVVRGQKVTISVNGQLSTGKNVTAGVEIQVPGGNWNITVRAVGEPELQAGPDPTGWQWGAEPPEPTISIPIPSSITGWNWLPEPAPETTSPSSITSSSATVTSSVK